MSNGLNLGSEGAVAGRSPRRSTAKRMATGHGAVTDQVLENGREILSNLVFWDFGQAAACWIPSTNFLPSRSSVIC